MIATARDQARFLEDVRDLATEVERTADEAFAPRAPRSIAEWAEDERILPRSSSAEGGRFRNARVPYLRGIMDALNDPRVPSVVVMKGAQVAGSTIGENWVGWTMDEEPAPMLVVWPTEKLLRRWSLTRLDPMIEATPRLKRLFRRSGMRDSGDAIAHKEFPNGTLDLLTARSSSDLRSISAARVWFSEVDNIIAELTEDGDPIELARSRGETFWDFKEYLESTPTVAGASRIYDELSRTSWNDWWMPCPHCKQQQVLRWRDGMEDGDADVSGDVRFLWDEDAHGQPIPGSVCYVCEHHGCEIRETSKAWMLARGAWRARHDDRLAQGFHIPAWISPLISWDRIATRFVRAKKSDARMRTFVNNICGMPYAERSSRVSQHFLAQRAEVYRADVPKGVKVLVAGGDVQGSTVHFTVWGVGAGEEMWALRWLVFDGSVENARVRREIHEALRQPLLDEAGRQRFIAAACVDARYNTGAVHRLCRDFVGAKGAKLLPIIGKEGRARPIIADPPPQRRRRSGQRAQRSRVVGIDGIKDMLFERLQRTEPGPEYVHFPEGLDGAFYAQLTAEELRTEYKDRRPRRVWRKKSPDLANEVLDTTVYAYAALHSLGLRVIQELSALATVQPVSALDDDEGTAGSASAEAPAVVTRASGPRRLQRPRVVSPGVY